MTKERFEQIQKMTEEERLQLSKEEISQYYDYIANSSNTSVSIPTEVYVEAGVEIATETLLITTGASEKLIEVSSDLSKGITPTQTVGTVGKVAVFLSMSTNIYSMIKGDFKWDLLNTVNLVSSTLACLVLLGVNVACLGALATILASNPFTIGLAVVCVLVNYFSIGEVAEKLKKTYLSCFNSYRRIYKLCNWADTNELVYKNFNSVLDFAKNEILKIKDDFINSQYYKTDMRRKIFIGADFNSFVLFNNVITFIQSKQELSTAKGGVYNDYIDFCSIEDYIDTHEIIKQDLARIEYFILQNDLKSLKDYVISVDFLTGYFDTYKLNSFLTSDVRKDIDFVLKCVNKIKSAIGQQGLLDLKTENQQFKNVRNPQELFNSIYSYLIYANAMRNSPFTVCKTLLNPEYYSSQNIYEYVSAFSEYPVYLFSNWFFYFGNIMFNDIYIEKYKTELISAYNLNKSLYTKEFFEDLIKDIDTYNDFKICLIWLYGIKEFLQNIYDENYLQYLPYFATSFTQSGITEDGKTLYNYYIPNNDYKFKSIKELIKNFVNSMENYGYDTSKFSSLLDNFWLLSNYDIKISLPYLSLKNIKTIFGINTNEIFKDNYIDVDIDLLDKLGQLNSYKEFFYNHFRMTKDVSEFLLLFILAINKRVYSVIYNKLYEFAYKNNLIERYNLNFDLETLAELVIENFDIEQVIDLDNSQNKKELISIFEEWKSAYNEYKSKIKTDIKFAQDLINEQVSDFDRVLNKYPQFDSSLSYAYTGKYDVYLWNIYKLAVDLARNNKSYLTNIEKHLVPVYKIEDNNVCLDTYYPPMFILMSAKDDTDLSQSYYLINQVALNNLFNIGNEKFEEKIKEYKDLVSLTIQPEIAVIDHKQIVDDVSQNIKKMYSINKEQMIELLGSQEDEFILIQNLLNQEILKQAKENDVSIPEIDNALNTNKYLAQSTQNNINSNKSVLDKKCLIKYAMGVGLALFVFNRGKK